MKKQVSAICLAALLLTGCGGAAGTAGSSTPDAAQSSQAVAEQAEQKEESKAAESSEAAEELEYYDWTGIDMPIPAGMEKQSRASMKNLRCWTDDKGAEAVYYAFTTDFYIAPDSLDVIPEQTMKCMDEYFYVVFESDTSADYSKMTADETSDEDFLGFPTRRIKGTVTLDNGTKLNYIAHYAFMDFWESERTHKPSFWIAYTASDSKDALDRMEQAAALPLTQAKLHPTV